MNSAPLHPEVAHALPALMALFPERTQLIAEKDNADYGASVTLPAATRIRVAKVTPKKLGLFVAVWQRNTAGTTQPLPSDDGTQRLLVIAREGDNYGVFNFPLKILIARGIVSVDGVGGKRGFRVYPPWSQTQSRQAQRTQEWQCEHFLSLAQDAPEHSPDASSLRN